MSISRASGRLVKNAALAAILASLVAGCAGDAPRGELRFGIDEAPAGRGLLWPQPPEIPRYAYAGELTGEANFRRPAGAERGLTGFLRMLAGVDEPGETPVVLQRPLAGTVDAEGRIYVTDASRQAVFVFDGVAGELKIWEQAAGLTRFVAPAGIALGARGEVLVADAELGYVVRLDREGNPVGRIGQGQLTRPTGLARDGERGLIYVADTHAHDVKVFDDEGRLVRVLGSRGEGEGEFNFPTHLAHANGELYVTDTMNSRVQVFGAEGEALNRRLGARGLFIGNLVRPKGVAVDGEGNVYVVESYYDTLLIFNARGEFLMPLGGTGTEPGRFYLPAGVWIDRGNRVFVADMFNGRVVVFQFLGGN